MLIKRFYLFLFCIMLPPMANAWNGQGHQQVGTVADRLIVGSHAEKWVHYLLGDMNLRTVSVWADCAKGVKNNDGRHFSYQNNAQYVECQPFDNPQAAQRFERFIAHNWKQCNSVRGNESCSNQYHYADVASVHDHYAPGYIGTSDHDVVHAIDAAIAVLRRQPCPVPFDIADQQEALMLLVHYVGDIHQPLHVTALYLDSHGAIVDPDRQGYRIGYDTAGGNNTLDDHNGRKSLHAEWDTPPNNIQIADLLQLAKQVPPTTGDLKTWSVIWATDSVKVGKQVFAGLHFNMKPSGWGNPDYLPEKWEITGIDSAYQRRADDIKRHQLAKAGARLAQLLKTIWPENQALPPLNK